MYKPLPDFLKLKDSSIHGLGLFANKNIKKNVCLGVTHIQDDRFEDSYIRTALGAFFNHSETPNVDIVAAGDILLLVSNRDIAQGEEITARYTLYNPADIVKYRQQ